MKHWPMFCCIDLWFRQVVVSWLQRVAELDLAVRQVDTLPPPPPSLPCRSTSSLPRFRSLFATSSTSAFQRATLTWRSLSSRPIQRGRGSSSTAAFEHWPRSSACRTTPATSTSISAPAACSDASWHAYWPLIARQTSRRPPTRLGATRFSSH